MKQCPICRGNRYVPTLVSTERLRWPVHDVVLADCRTCSGSGEVTADRADALSRGKALRDARVAKGQTLLEAAAERGISPAELSAIETGRRR